MPAPSFLAVVDAVPSVTDQLVVCLGRPRQLPPLPPEQLLVLDKIDAQGLSRIAALDPRRMGKGLVLVTTRGEHARSPRGVLRAQKLLALLYAKFVDLPCTSTRIPDPIGLRPEDTPPEYLHLLNRYRNTPLHLRHCLVDKLAAARVGLPCLLLLPGPSLRLLKDRLPELARRHLIVTISRVLPFLRQCGVEPDVLVQLDTVPMQEHFHHPEERFPDAVLLALSMAPVRSFAPRFRQVFFIDSFDLSLLPNPARLRESWLSSLLACLGAVEALHAPQVLLIGADLRLSGQGTYYADADDFPPAPAFDSPLVSSAGAVTLADAQGRRVDTTLPFFATAAEAELFAQAIHAATGTVFRNLSPVSLLDPDVCAPMRMDEALAAPVLDKTPLLAKADAAAAQAEDIDPRAVRARYASDLEEAKRGRDIMTCLRYSAPESVSQHPCHRYVAANVPWFRPAGAEDLTRLAANLAEELCAATRFARNVAALHCQAAKGAAIPVLCTAEEEAEVRARLAALPPAHGQDWTWRFMGVRALGTGRPEPSSGCVEQAALCDWMHFQDVLVLAPGCAREFGYALDLMRDDNVLDLEELLAYAPPR
ncbi:motility associated factor glycosyltransferase family protein [Humidesulfovibrio idahonensis]